MKPLTHCPGCHNKLASADDENYSFQYCESIANKCELYYDQHVFRSSESLSRIKFSTKKFRVHYYIDYFDLQNTIHIYLKSEISKPYSQIVLIIPGFEIDFNKVDELDKRWNLWLKFI